MFSEYGTVKSVILPLDRETGEAIRFGFVSMATDAQETEAIEALNTAEWMGRKLKMNKAFLKSFDKFDNTFEWT